MTSEGGYGTPEWQLPYQIKPSVTWSSRACVRSLFPGALPSRFQSLATLEALGTKITSVPRATQGEVQSGRRQHKRQGRTQQDARDNYEARWDMLPSIGETTGWY